MDAGMGDAVDPAVGADGEPIAAGEITPEADAPDHVEGGGVEGSGVEGSCGVVSAIRDGASCRSTALESASTGSVKSDDEWTSGDGISCTAVAVRLGVLFIVVFLRGLGNPRQSPVGRLTRAACSSLRRRTYHHTQRL